jgi:hypothetical protein
MLSVYSTSDLPFNRSSATLWGVVPVLPDLVLPDLNLVLRRLSPVTDLLTCLASTLPLPSYPVQFLRSPIRSP